MRVMMIENVIVAQKTLPKRLERGLEGLEIGGRFKTIQTTYRPEESW